MPKTLEQLIADNDRLTADLTAVQGQLAAMTAERDVVKTELATITHKRDEAASQLATVTAERDTLKADNAKLTADMADFNGKVAAEIAKHGVRPAALETKDAPKGKNAPTLTETCRAAHAPETK